MIFSPKAQLRQVALPELIVYRGMMERTPRLATYSIVR